MASTVANRYWVKFALVKCVGGHLPAHQGKFVAYFRVSKDRQGKSGLGLEAQRKSVLDYLDGGRWDLVRGVHRDRERSQGAGQTSRKPEAPRGQTACGCRQKERADRYSANVLPVIREIQRSGIKSLRGVARALAARGIPTPRGGA